MATPRIVSAGVRSKMHGAERARAQDRRVDDPLVELLAGQALAQRLRHEVHEVEGALAVVRGLPAQLLPPVGLLRLPVQGEAERRHDQRGGT